MASGEFLDIDDDYDEILSLVPESIVHENRRITGKNVFGGTGSSSLGSEFKNPNDFVINVATKKREINTTALFFLTQSKNVDGLTDSRKFPGPAGVLPTGSVIAAETSDALKPPLIEKVTRTENSSTQSTLNKLISERQEYISKDPWKFLLRCLNILNDAFGDKSQRIPTIEWLRRNAPRLPDETHLPLLVAVVYGNPMPESLRTIRQTTPSVTLVDPSGIILAALTPSFIEEFADKVSNGTAIALKNVSGQFFGGRCKQHECV